MHSKIAMLKYLLVQYARAADKGLIDNIIGVDRNRPAGSNLDTVINAIIKAINVGVYLASLAAAIMILFSAFQYVTAYGDESKAATAKKTLIWSIAGLAVIAVVRITVVWLEAVLGESLGGLS